MISMATQKFQCPDIFQYSDYKTYLQDYYLFAKKADAKYSYRYFAKKIGFKSAATLPMIFSGQRNLSLNSVKLITQGLELKSKEKIYFELLVKHALEKDAIKKQKIFLDMLSMQDGVQLNEIEEREIRVISSWSYLAIYVLIGTHPKLTRNYPFCEKLRYPVSPEEVSEAIEELINLGLVIEELGTGHLRQSKGALSISDKVKSALIKRYHIEMLQKSIDSLERDPLSERNFNGVTLPVSQATYPYLVEKIHSFRKELNELASSFEGSTDVYHLNLHLFPLTTNRELS